MCNQLLFIVAILLRNMRLRTRIDDSRVTIVMAMMVHPIFPVTTMGDDDDDDDGFNLGDGAFDGDGDDGNDGDASNEGVDYSLPPDTPPTPSAYLDTGDCIYSDDGNTSPMPWTPSPMSQWGIYEQ